MPNWCSNSLEIMHDDASKLEEFIEAYNQGKLGNHFRPQPRWHSEPLSESDCKKYRYSESCIGELPLVRTIAELEGTVMLEFDGKQDLRWRDWRLENWGVKWDFGRDSGHDNDDADYFTKDGGKIVYVRFDTPWGPPDKWLEHMETLGFRYILDWREEGGHEGEIMSDNWSTEERSHLA